MQVKSDEDLRQYSRRLMCSTFLRGFRVKFLTRPTYLHYGPWISYKNRGGGLTDGRTPAVLNAID